MTIFIGEEMTDQQIMQLISGANNKDLEALEDKDEKKEPS